MIGSKLLVALLWPVILLERMVLNDKDKKKYGKLPKSEGAIAMFERWGVMMIGVFSGIFGLSLIGLAVTAGFGAAVFIDPFIWARKGGMQVVAVERKDFVVGAVVNLAPIWLFWLGFMIGGGLGAV